MSESAHAHPVALDVKSCCAMAYDSEWARLLLGDPLHPGGLVLTERVGELLDLPPGSAVLDVACGRGTSGVHLAQRFGFRAIGIDANARQLTEAARAATQAGVGQRVALALGDAEALPLRDGAVDAVISECSLCLMPDKRTAVREMARVLRPGGRLAIADVTVRGRLPAELSTLVAHVVCLGDARSPDEYAALMADAGLCDVSVEAHDHELRDLVRRVQLTLLGVAAAARLGRLDLDPDEVQAASRLARAAGHAVRDGTLGYAILTARRDPR